MRQKKISLTTPGDNLWLESRYLYEDIFDHLSAVIVHTDITGEGLAKENISDWEMEKEAYQIMFGNSKWHKFQIWFKALPKILWQGQHFPQD